MSDFSKASLLVLLVPSIALGQSAAEHHIWQDQRSFEPMSRTAQAIMGPIKLSGNPNFARTGSRMTITFGTGTSTVLTSVEGSWREWDLAAPKKITAEVFRFEGDPGELEHGNTLCGDPAINPARYVVFYEDILFDQPMLGVAVFRSRSAPKNIHSSGLCGTFSFNG
ncbi:hypothetical protein ACD589_15595 [Rhizobium sp. 814_E9_N1_1]|uniref:hypothetical protein n=1 Tax=unclassified Rhizobium TaxID=2613769 RepID=UPI003F27BE34